MKPVAMVLMLVCAAGASDAVAATWHVKADAAPGGDGSRGRNRLANNPGLDIAVTNANAATSPVTVDASSNYWGSGPPDVSITGNVKFNAARHLQMDPAR